jgi:hypothetical protein
LANNWCSLLKTAAVSNGYMLRFSTFNTRGKPSARNLQNALKKQNSQSSDVETCQGFSGHSVRST